MPRLSKHQKLIRREQVKEQIAETKKQIEEVKALDPFWYYQPSDGVISDEGKALMRDYLEEEDIPQRCDCQLDVHLSNADINGAFGGNRGGKTVLGAIEAFIWATGEVPDSLKDIYPKEKIPTEFPQHIRVETVDYATLNDVILPTYQEWVPRDYLIDGSWGKSYSAEHRTLKLGKKNELI